MPELPEVETIARCLRDEKGTYRASIVGCKIIDAHVLWARTLANIKPKSFRERIIGQIIRSISRRGKFLVLSLTSDTLLIHLRMSGDMRIEKVSSKSAAPKETEKHDRIVLFFENGLRIAFNDTRKFGRVWLLKDPQEVLTGLGPEPFDKDLNPDTFFKMLRGRSRQLKPLLMDQRFLAGLGNIYTDEALHLAKIHPLSRSDELGEEEARRLLTAIHSILLEGIRRNGASIDRVYRGGEFQNHFRAYGRTGEPCPECGAEIVRLVVGQRGTHICPECQKMT